MADTFMVGDLHLGHKGMVNFLQPDGTKQRPWDTIEEHDDAIVANWNKVVRPKDKVYVLGDACLGRSALSTLARLNGTKVLIMGNHDIFKASEYLEYFSDLAACKEYDNALLSHMPVHTNQMYRYKYNVHGHQHHLRTMLDLDMPDYRYRCVSLEQVDYTPISWEMLKKELEWTNEM